MKFFVITKQKFLDRFHVLFDRHSNFVDEISIIDVFVGRENILPSNCFMADRNFIYLSLIIKIVYCIIKMYTIFLMNFPVVQLGRIVLDIFSFSLGTLIFRLRSQQIFQ